MAMAIAANSVILVFKRSSCKELSVDKAPVNYKRVTLNLQHRKIPYVMDRSGFSEVPELVTLEVQSLAEILAETQQVNHVDDSVTIGVESFIEVRVAS